MRLGVVKIRNFKDGTQKGSYTSLSDRQIMADTDVEYYTNSFSDLMQEEVVAKKYPE